MGREIRAQGLGCRDFGKEIWVEGFKLAYRLVGLYSKLQKMEGPFAIGIVGDCKAPTGFSVRHNDV